MIEKASSKQSPSGLLLINKPAGITSARAVAMVKRALGRQVRVGHLGTLDPFASGLLPLCLGQATKIAPYLNEDDKAYSGTIRLGVTSDTLDATGALTETRPPPKLDQSMLDPIAAEFTGTMKQIPPRISAIKVDGVPMHRRTRRGEDVTPEPRSVTIYACALQPEGPERIHIDVHCSKGTYVRSLARDIGRRLGTDGVLESLVRTKFGRFGLADAVLLDDFVEMTKSAGQIPDNLLMTANEALAHLVEFRVDSTTAVDLRAGRQGALVSFDRKNAEENSAGRVVDRSADLVALIRFKNGAWKLDRVFGRPEATAH